MFCDLAWLAIYIYNYLFERDSQQLQQQQLVLGHEAASWLAGLANTAMYKTCP